jgi:hypothetical protein
MGVKETVVLFLKKKKLGLSTPAAIWIHHGVQSGLPFFIAYSAKQSAIL